MYSQDGLAFLTMGVHIGTLVHGFSYPTPKETKILGSFLSCLLQVVIANGFDDDILIPFNT